METDTKRLNTLFVVITAILECTEIQNELVSEGQNCVFLSFFQRRSGL